MRVGPLSRLSSRLAAAALVAATLPLLSVSPALAAPPAPANLTPDSTSIDGSPVLGWSRVKGATEYDVEIATSPDFSATLYDETTENSHATPTSNLPTGTDIYWRVRGVTASHVHGAWATAMFSHTTFSGPELLTPDDNAQLQQPEDSPLMTWSPVNGAISYTVEVDTDDQFIDTDSDTVKGTGSTFESPGVQQTYYWHVKANFAGNFSSDWSEIRSFEILPLPAPELVSPDDSSTTQVQDAVLDWAPVAGAVEYQVQVSTDDQFNTTVIDEDVKSTWYAPATTIDNDQYWWRVRAIDVNDNRGPWSTSLNQFQRNWPDQPSLVFPSDGAVVTTPLYYEWDGVPHASSYQLQVGPDPSFSPGSFETCTTTNTTYAAGRLTTPNCGPSDGTTYWRVRAIDGPRVPAVNGVYSEIHSFSYAPGMITQTSPDPSVPDILAVVPTLKWHAFPNAERYKVQIFKANGSIQDTETTYSLSFTPGGTHRLDPDDGPYSWKVSALFKDGTSTAVPLDGPTFTVPPADTVADDPEVAGLTPTSAEGQHTLRFPNLTWEPFFTTGTPAAYYRVFVAQASSSTFTALGDTYPYPSATDSSADWLAGGDYQWFARAYAQDGTVLGTGVVGHFTIDNLDAVADVRLSLTGEGLESPDTTCARTLPAVPTTADICSSLQNTPVLRWDPVPGAGFYMIYLARDRELTNVVLPPTNTAQQTVNTMWNPPTQLPDSQAGTAYYWVVRPCKTAGKCSPEPTQATNAFDKRSNPVTGLTETEHDASSPLPAHGPGGVTDPPEFADEVVLSWDDYLQTSQAGNNKDVTGMGSQVEARSYRVQISTDPNFSSGTIVSTATQGVDQTSWTPTTKMLPEGPLYWRVQAIDGSGNSLAWSLGRDTNGGTASIEKRSPTPVVNAPTGGDVVSGTPAFSWDALPYAAKYDVQVARHGDTTFSSANIAASGSKLRQTTYVPDSALSTDGNPYVWRVRRVDVDNGAGAWSDPQTFLVSADAPSQVSPNEGVFVSAKDAVFSWLPVDGASSYRFERRVQGSTTAQETKTTTGLAWAPEKHIPDGSYEWRVSSIDTSNKVIGASPWRPFRVDNIAPTVTRKRPVDNASPDSVITVDFSERVKGVTSSSFKIFVKGNHAALPATVRSTGSHKSATLKPTGKLKVGKTYTIKLLPAITDQAGHPIKPVTWQIKVKKKP